MFTAVKLGKTTFEELSSSLSNVTRQSRPQWASVSMK